MYNELKRPNTGHSVLLSSREKNLSCLKHIERPFMRNYPFPETGTKRTHRVKQVFGVSLTWVFE